MKKIIFIALAGVVILGASGVAGIPAARAANNADTDANTDTACAIPTADLTAIQTIQNDSSLSYADEVTQELAARKKLLSETIACAQSDAQSLQAALNAASPTGEGTTIQAQLSNNINDAMNYYSLESSKLPGAGISGTESVAKELLDWRTSNYEPLVANVNDFILWSGNQSLFETAENRLSQTKALVAFMESAAQNSTLQADFNVAESSLETAEAQNANAESALAESLSPDQSLALIQQSLQSLADTYQKFSTLNDYIQTLLPTNQ